MIIGRAGKHHHYARWRAPSGTVHHVITASRREAISSIAKEAFALHKQICRSPALHKGDSR